MFLNMIQEIFNTSFVFSAIRMATPILFAALAMLISNRAGASNIGIEGIMMISALTGVISSAYFQSAWLGLVCVLIIGIFFGLLIGFFTFEMKTDIILSGIAINIFGGGGTIFFLYIFSGDRGYSTSLSSKILPILEIPIIKNIPIIGEIFSGHNFLVYVSGIMVVLMHIFLYKTNLGLRIRAVGNNTEAVNSVGLNVKRIKYIALGISGLMAGLGGAFMSMGYMNGFNTNMVAGRGFIGIAAEAMGHGEPIGVMITSIIFGLSNALVNHIQGTAVSSQLIGAIPYVVVIVNLVIYAVIKKQKTKNNIC